MLILPESPPNMLDVMVYAHIPCSVLGPCTKFSLTSYSVEICKGTLSALPLQCFQALRRSKPSGEESMKAGVARPGVPRPIQICSENCSALLTAQHGANGQQGVIVSEPSQLDGCLSPIPSPSQATSALNGMF